MFVWFVMKDSDGSLWQSGVYRKTGAAKPAQSRFAARPRRALRKLFDGFNSIRQRLG